MLIPAEGSQFKTSRQETNSAAADSDQHVTGYQYLIYHAVCQHKGAADCHVTPLPNRKRTGSRDAGAEGLRAETTNCLIADKWFNCRVIDLQIPAR